MAGQERDPCSAACLHLTFLAWANASPGGGLESISAALEPNEVAARFMIDATRLVQDYFWPHARAALRPIGLTDRHHHIRRVLRWARANGRLELSLKDVRREALNGCVDAEQARDLVDRLVVAGWLRAEPVVQTGGRPRERWSVSFRNFSTLHKLQKAQKATFLQFLQFLQPPNRENGVGHEQATTLGRTLGDHQPCHQTPGSGRRWRRWRRRHSRRRRRGKAQPTEAETGNGVKYQPTSWL